jgi:hypothetical protein
MYKGNLPLDCNKHADQQATLPQATPGKAVHFAGKRRTYLEQEKTNICVHAHYAMIH